jgi:hypothetical protein
MPVYSACEDSIIDFQNATIEHHINVNSNHVLLFYQIP